MDVVAHLSVSFFDLLHSRLVGLDLSRVLLKLKLKSLDFVEILNGTAGAGADGAQWRRRGLVLVIADTGASADNAGSTTNNAGSPDGGRAVLA